MKTNPISKEAVKSKKIKWEEEFDKRFTDYNGCDVEPSFSDPNGDVGPVKSFIHTELVKAIEEKLTEIALNHFDSELGTYDYDGIAEEVLSINHPTT